MHIFIRAALIVPALALLVPGPATARYTAPNGKVYKSYSSYCKAKRSRAAKRGTVIGAASGAGIGVIAGGNVGETLLGAGGGAIAGNVIGRKTTRC